MTLAVTILTDKFDRALLYATHVHGGGSEDMAIAGLLHDAVEDQGGEPRLADIRNRFGEIDERQATNQHEVYVSIWAKAVETQMHFNEMAVKSRQFGLAFVAAALGLGIVLIARGEDVGIPIPYVLGWQLPVSHTIKQTRFRASCSARAPSVSWPQGLLADRGALASISRAFVLARDCDGSASPTQQCFQIVLSPQSQKVGVHQLSYRLIAKFSATAANGTRRKIAALLRLNTLDVYAPSLGRKLLCEAQASLAFTPLSSYGTRRL